jgi:hypothetical protein
LLQALADEGEDCSGGVSTAVFGFISFGDFLKLPG